MGKKYVHIYCGRGNGKTAAALGRAVKLASCGKSVFFIQFLKGTTESSLEYYRRLEPELKIFSFDQFDRPFMELSDEEKKEEKAHIRNGFAFARKVMLTGECDALVLDEAMLLPGKGILEPEEIINLMQGRSAAEDFELILTGEFPHEELWPYADEVTEVITAYEGDRHD